MMNSLERIERTFSKGKVLAAYLTAGDGGIQHTLDAALALIAGGIDMLEIGVPFSDPIADGPVIQRAATRALAAGTTLQEVLWLTKQIRAQSDIPLILFSYYNPILSAMEKNFFHEAKQAGFDGALIIDCPIEESATFHQQCLEEAIAPIYVITPSTPPERIRQIEQYGKGFLYYACRKGTTGLSDTLPADFTEKIHAIKALVKLPVLVGFGISQRNMTQQVLQHADGVVVGSLFVKAVEEGMQPAELTALASSLR